MGLLSSLYRLKNNLRLFGSLLLGTMSITLTLLLVGCSMPPKKTDDNFCMKVDPSSPDYNPNALSLEQLKVCRERVEKILQVQTMQVQIHRQRDEVVALNDNDLIIENKAVIENALAKLPENNKIRSANNSSTTPRNVIVRKTPALNNTAGKPEAVQQHFLNNNSQRQFDAMQADRIATKVETLINSEEKQAILNTPRSLQPGEETRIQKNPTANIGNINTAEIADAKLARPMLNASDATSQNKENSSQNVPTSNTIKADSEVNPHADAKTLKYKTIQTNNSVTKTLINPSNENKAPSSSVNQTKNEVKPNRPSTDYTSLPNFSASIENKGKQTEQMALQESSTSEVKPKTIPEPIIDGKTRPDPLLRLQEIRNQN